MQYQWSKLMTKVWDSHLPDLWSKLVSGVGDGQKIINDLFEEPDLDKQPQPSMADIVEQARREWVSAQNYYNNVTDTDLIDHAVYMMQAAEKKYMYLLKKARREGVTYSPYS